MFTGIVESMAEIQEVHSVGQNKTFILGTPFASELATDQSVSHNGVCLTVEEVNVIDKKYQVSAIAETLDKTTLGDWSLGDLVNVERAVTLNQRLDGHLVQGHVDRTIRCLDVQDRDGSVVFQFVLPDHDKHLVIPQGSITLDGISLTVARMELDTFSVAIIPYTYDHTVARFWKPGRAVNVEYDVFGKYLARYRELYQLAMDSDFQIEGSEPGRAGHK